MHDLEADDYRPLTGDWTAFGATPAFIDFLDPDLGVLFVYLATFASYFNSVAELFLVLRVALF